MYIQNNLINRYNMTKFPWNALNFISYYILPHKLGRFECIKTICARIKASRDAHAKPKKVCWSENDITRPCTCFENGRKCLCIVKTALLEMKDVLEFAMHTCMHDLHQTPQKHYNGLVNLLVLVFTIWISSNMMSSGQGELLMTKTIATVNCTMDQQPY